MSTFVLVHGAWQTASTWDLVVPQLREAGHTVVVPQLSGLENDDVVLSPAITLRTHIEDVSKVIHRESPDHFILVGHSYAGMIIISVAERFSQRIDRLVYVDACFRDGQSVLNLLSASLVERFRQAVNSSGDGWRLRAGEAQLDMWGLKPGAGVSLFQARDLIH